MRRVLIATLLLLLLGVFWQILDPAVRLAGFVLSLAAGLIWLLWLRRDGIEVRLQPPLIVLALFLLLRLISSLWSANPATGLSKASLELAAFLFLLYVLQTMRSGWTRRVWEDALIMLAGVLAALEILLALAWYSDWWRIAPSGEWLPPVGYRANGLLLQHPNVLAGFLNLALIVLVVRWLKAERARDRIILTLITLIYSTVLFLTSSRGGFLGGVVGILAAVAVWGWLRQDRSLQAAMGSLQAWLRQRPALSLLAAVGAVAGITIFFWQAGRTGHLPGLSARTGIWGPAWDLFRAHPLIGIGAGAFPTAYAASVEFLSLANLAHAHNLWLHVAVELGLVGFILLVMLIVSLAAWLWRVTARSGPAEAGALAVLYGVGAAVLVHHMVDYLFGPMLYTLGVYIFVAFLMSAEGPGNQEAGAGIQLPLAVILGAMVLLGTFKGVEAWRQQDAYQGVRAAERGEWERSVALLCDTRLDRIGAFRAEQCAIASQYAAYLGGESLAGGRGLGAMLQAYESDPGWSRHGLNYGVALASTGQYEEAERVLRANTEEYGLIGEHPLELARILEKQGEYERASYYYRLAVGRMPLLGLSMYMQASELRRLAAQSPIVTREPSAALSSYIDGERALARGRSGLALEHALESIDHNPRFGRAHALAGRATLAQGELDSATQALQRAAFINPGDPYVHAALGALALEIGESSEAADHLLRALRMITYTTNSRLYYHAAYGQLGLHVDKVPMAIRYELQPWMIEPLRQADRQLQAGEHDENLRLLVLMLADRE